MSDYYGLPEDLLDATLPAIRHAPYADLIEALVYIGLLELWYQAPEDDGPDPTFWTTHEGNTFDQRREEWEGTTPAERVREETLGYLMAVREHEPADIIEQYYLEVRRPA